AVSLDAFASLYAFPRFLACVTEGLPAGQPLPNLADLIQERCEKLLEQGCMPVQNGGPCEPAAPARAAAGAAGSWPFSWFPMPGPDEPALPARGVDHLDQRALGPWLQGEG